MRKHSDESKRPFPCDSCDQRFIRLDALINHRRAIHTGERPFVCNLCHKGFINIKHLNNHRLVHTDLRIFKCDKCEKDFRSASALKTHQLKHDGIMKYQCKYCGHKFWEIGNMVKHMRRIHPEGEYGGLDSSKNNISHRAPLQSSMGQPQNVSTVARKRNSSPRKQRQPQHIDHSSAAGSIDDSSETFLATQNILDTSGHHNQQQNQYIDLQQLLFPRHESTTVVPDTMSVPQAFHPLHHPSSGHSDLSTHHLTTQQIQQQQFYGHHQQQHNSSGQNLYHNPVQVSGSNCVNMTQVIQSAHSGVSYSGGCRYCDKIFVDIRQHIVEFHRIPESRIDEGILRCVLMT